MAAFSIDALAQSETAFPKKKKEAEINAKADVYLGKWATQSVNLYLGYSVNVHSRCSYSGYTADSISYYVKKSTEEEYPDTALENHIFTPTEVGTYDCWAAEIHYLSQILDGGSVLLTIYPAPTMSNLTASPTVDYVGTTFSFSVDAANYVTSPEIKYYVKKSTDAEYPDTALVGNTFVPTEAGEYSVKAVGDDPTNKYHKYLDGGVELGGHIETEAITFTVLAVPEITSLTVTPSTGYVGGTFTFSATYENFIDTPEISYYVKNSSDEDYPATPIDGNIFIPTTAGTYTVKAVATCGPETSAEKTATFTVLVGDYTLTVTDLGWASLYYDRALKIPGGVKVYYANAIDNDDVTLVQMSGNIPAGTGVIVQSEPGTVSFPLAEGEVSVLEDTNLFKGLLADKSCGDVATEEGKKIYTLAGKESDGTLLFMLYDTSLNLHANRIYMPLAGNSEIKYLRIADDDATGINSFRSTKTNNGKVVNLLGVPVDDNYKGIILKGGKKILKK